MRTKEGRGLDIDSIKSTPSYSGGRWVNEFGLRTFYRKQKKKDNGGIG